MQKVYPHNIWYQSKSEIQGNTIHPPSSPTCSPTTPQTKVATVKTQSTNTHTKKCLPRKPKQRSVGTKTTDTDNLLHKVPKKQKTMSKLNE